MIIQESKLSGSERLQALRTMMKKEAASYDGLFINGSQNRAYLSGFQGSFGYLLVTPDEALLFTDGRYIEQAQEQAPGWKIIRLQRPFEDNIIPEIKRLKLARLAFEADHLTYQEYRHWSEGVKQTEWVAVSGLVAGLRRRKDEVEIEAIRQAVHIAEQAFGHLLGLLKPGMSERNAAAELEFAMRKFGADAIAFDTIVASGPRGALPHGRAGDKLIVAGELVTFDFGARLNGYNSDITRTVYVGGGQQPDARQRQIYDTVLQAQLAGIAAVQPGAIASEVDAKSRQVFQEAGLLTYYLHSTGHNLGRDVHEAPFLTSSDHSRLEEGMILTVEPGLYISEWGGVRIEDDLLVTKTGSEVLSTFTKELVVL